VIPIHIRGARDVLPRGAFFPTGGARVRVRFGKALLPADYDPGEGVAGHDGSVATDSRGDQSVTRLPRPRAV